MNQPNAIASTEDFEFSALSEAINYRHAIIKEFEDFLKGDVLEIGVGIGQISEAILALPSVNKLVGVEPEPKFQDGFKERLPHIRLVEGTTSNLQEGEKFHSAIMVNVLEHIEQDEDELRTIHKSLKSHNGSICILVPARQEIYSKLDSHFGHFRRYDKPMLKNKLERAGFQIEKLHYFNMVGYFAWAIRYKLLRGMDFDIKQVRLFDRKIFPPTNKLERKFRRPPFGQSLIAVARAI